MVGYYYCSFEVFTSLLHSRSIWLTDLTKSNDSEEVRRLYDNIWDELKLRLQQSDLPQDVVETNIQQFEYAKAPQLYFDIPFGCCMSYENDLVQQWREYGDKGCGVAIGFELEWFNIKHQLPITSCSVAASIGYEAVTYDSRTLRNGFYKIFYQAIKEYGLNAWLMAILPTFKHYAGFVKNPTFRDEKEIRILFYPSEHFEDTLDGLSGLQENIKPHYCLDWANNISNAMRSITVGYNCKHTPEEILELVKCTGLAYKDQVTIFRSGCSYQDRK